MTKKFGLVVVWIIAGMFFLAIFGPALGFTMFARFMESNICFEQVPVSLVLVIVAGFILYYRWRKPKETQT